MKKNEIKYSLATNEEIGFYADHTTYLGVPTDNYYSNIIDRAESMYVLEKFEDSDNNEISEDQYVKFVPMLVVSDEIKNALIRDRKVCDAGQNKYFVFLGSYPDIKSDEYLQYVGGNLKDPCVGTYTFPDSSKYNVYKDDSGNNYIRANVDGTEKNYIIRPLQWMLNAETNTMIADLSFATCLKPSDLRLNNSDETIECTNFFKNSLPEFISNLLEKDRLYLYNESSHYGEIVDELICCIISSVRNDTNFSNYYNRLNSILRLYDFNIYTLDGNYNIESTRDLNRHEIIELIAGLKKLYDGLTNYNSRTEINYEVYKYLLKVKDAIYGNDACPDEFCNLIRSMSRLCYSEKERESLEYDVFSRFMEKVSTEFNYAYINNDFICDFKNFQDFYGKFKVEIFNNVVETFGILICPQVNELFEALREKIIPDYNYFDYEKNELTNDESIFLGIAQSIININNNFIALTYGNVEKENELSNSIKDYIKDLNLNYYGAKNIADYVARIDNELQAMVDQEIEYDIKALSKANKIK